MGVADPRTPSAVSIVAILLDREGSAADRVEGDLKEILATHATPHISSLGGLH